MNKKKLINTNIKLGYGCTNRMLTMKIMFLCKDIDENKTTYIIISKDNM